MNGFDETIVHEGKTFTGINYAEKRLENREFIRCEFINCDFSKSDLSHNDFMECHFKQCNFSMTIVKGTGFKDAKFTGSLRQQYRRSAGKAARYTGNVCRSTGSF
jgi:fluoroquinolone resistance protein